MTTLSSPARIGFWSAVRLVAEREVRMRLRSKAFLISTGILLLIVLGSVVAGGLFGANPPATKVAVTAGLEQLAQVPGFEVTEVDSVDAAEQLVLDGDVEAAVVPKQDAALGIEVLGTDSVPSSLLGALSVSPEVRLLQPVDQDPFLIYLVALGFGLMFFISAMTFGLWIAQSVVEEKQTRIVEILMSAVPARALLAGKILGNSVLAMGQIVAIVVLVAVGMLATGQDLLLGEIGASLGWFAVFFLFGFVLLAAMYSATAALVSRQEDVGSTTGPVTYLIVIPYVLVIMFNNNPVVLGIMSYVPFSAPVGMPMRIFLGTAEWWEPLLSLVVLLATTALIVLIGARIYSNSLLRTGGRVSLKEALGN